MKIYKTTSTLISLTIRRILVIFLVLSVGPITIISCSNDDSQEVTFKVICSVADFEGYYRIDNGAKIDISGSLGSSDFSDYTNTVELDNIIEIEAEAINVTEDVPLTITVYRDNAKVKSVTKYVQYSTREYFSNDSSTSLEDEVSKDSDIVVKAVSDKEVVEVAISLNISHSSDGTITEISLDSPLASAILLQDLLLDTDEYLNGTMFDNDYNVIINNDNDNPDFSEIYLPDPDIGDNGLPNFNALEPDGTWTLNIEDNPDTGEAGTLTSWTLYIYFKSDSDDRTHNMTYTLNEEND